MKLIYTIFTASLVLVLLLNNAAGPGSVQGTDRTGSPLSPATCAASGCHTSNSFSPSIAATLLMDDTLAVTEYEPGEQYTLQLVTTAGTGTPLRYGFQTVALKDSLANTGAGTFGTPPTGFKKVTLSGRVYIEHSSPRTKDTLKVTWTAPAAGSGKVRFYASGIAANGNGSSTGDGTATLGNNPLIVNELIVAGVRTTPLLSSFEVLPNPVTDQLTLRMVNDQGKNFQMVIADGNGRILHKQRLTISAGESVQQFDFSSFQTGVYLVSITDGRRYSTAKVLKL